MRVREDMCMGGMVGGVEVWRRLDSVGNWDWWFEMGFGVAFAFYLLDEVAVRSV